MKILFNIGHPAHVHLFKNAIRSLESKGHECLITVINKDVSIKLLQKEGFRYLIVGQAKRTVFGKALETLIIETRLLKIVSDFKPQLLVGGVGNIYVAHVGKLSRIPSIVFDDTEHSKLELLLMLPFVSTILTPNSYMINLGKKQVRYKGFHELAYLHPNYFKPNPAVLADIGLTENDRFIIVRFVSWQASHDVGQHGILNKIWLVKELERFGRVLITSEGKISPELSSYKVKISPDKMHDLLYYASLYIGEGATMASEAAVLGTPSVYISSLVGSMGNFLELESTFDLLYSYKSGDAALEKAREILGDPNSKKIWKEKRERLLGEKIDLTSYMVQNVEKYDRARQRI